MEMSRMNTTILRLIFSLRPLLSSGRTRRSRDRRAAVANIFRPHIQPTTSRLRSGYLFGSALVLAAVLLCAPSPAEAASPRYLSAEPMHGKRIRIDGALLEWPGGFAPLSVRAKGSGGGGEVLVGYDDQYLYVGAKLKDDRITRTRGAGKGEDHLTLELHFPSPKGGAGRTHRVDVYPGDPGKLPALVQVDGRKAKGAKAVEAPTRGGLTLEARVPWSVFPEAAKVRVGLHGKLTYTDAASPGRVRAVHSTGKGNGQSMPRLTLESETGLIQALLEPKRLSLTPARVAYGDVTGKGGAERVALYGHFLSIAGPGYKGGKQFYFNELDVSSADRVKRLELRDMNGDGKDEIILRKRIGPDDAYREILQILQVGPDGVPVSVFAHEVALVTQEGRVVNEVDIKGSGKRAQVVISQGQARGFDPGTFREPKIGGGIHSALLPWESVGTRVFAWQREGLALSEERTWKPKMSSPSAGAGAPDQEQPPAPRPPSADEMLERVYALYRKDRGVGHKKPNFDFVTDVVEDDRMERVLVHGRDLVVFGKGFKNGQSYTFLTIGVEKEGDILSVTTRDLVGDGKAEILVHAVLNAQASKQLGGDVVQRQALFVYKIVGEQLRRIFAAETGRALGDDRILGAVAFLPSESGVELELRPLRTLGWTEKTYPFPQDASPAGGLEPLLVPWGSQSARRYRFDGQDYSLK